MSTYKFFESFIGYPILSIYSLTALRLDPFSVGFLTELKSFVFAVTTSDSLKLQQYSNGASPDELIIMIAKFPVFFPLHERFPRLIPTSTIDNKLTTSEKSTILSSLI